MTVSSQGARVSYLGNGATTGFAYPYPFFAASDLLVLLFDTATSLIVTPAPVLNGAGAYDYTVSGVQDPSTGEYAGGATITTNTPPPGGLKLILLNAIPLTQSLSIQPSTKIPTGSVNGEFDRLTLLTQQLLLSGSYAITAPLTDEPQSLALPPAALRANNALAFGGAGQPVCIPLTQIPGVAFTDIVVPAMTPLQSGVANRLALQAALVTAAAEGAAVYMPAGGYVLDASVPIVFPSNTILLGAGRGATLLQPDLSTVPAYTVRPFPLINSCFIGAGNPVTGLRAGQAFASGPSEFMIAGQDGVGSLDPSSFVWNCHFRDFTILPLNLATYLNTSLGANVFLNGLQLTGCMDSTVERVDAIGLPNDGITSFFTNAKMRNCRAWLNGFSGGSLGQSTTRNGISNLGWMDITNPAILTTRGAEVIDCDARYNHDEGISAGIGEGVKVLGNTLYGNGRCGIEGNSLQVTNLTAWKKSWAVTVATSACYANGDVYVCVTSGTTASSGTGPAGTGSNIADGSAAWNFAGTMDASGRIPASAIIDCNDIDGFIPATCSVYGVSYAIPAGWGNAQGYSGIQWDTGNEASVVIGGGNLIRNVGVAGDTSGFDVLGVSCANGGHFNLGNVQLENCAPGDGHQIFLGVSSAVTGQSFNDTGLVNVGAPTILNPGSAGDALIVDGYFTDVSIGALRADTGCRDGVVILAKGNVTAVAVDGAVIEGCQGSPFYIDLPAAAQINNLSLKNARGYNTNIAGGGTDSFLRLDGASGVFIAELMMTGCEASYASAGIGYPIGGTGMNAGSIGNAWCYNNNLNMGANNLLTMDGAASRLFPSSGTIAGQLVQDNNGLPGQIVNTSGANAAPTSGSWSNGDVSKVRGGTGGFFAGSSALEYVCTTSGTFGTLNGGATTGTTNGTTRFVTVNSAAGLAVRQWIHIVGTTNGPFQVTDFNGLTIGLSAVPNAAVTNAAVSYNAPAFTALTLN